MEQVARNASMQDSGYLKGCRYLLHDGDQKFCREFRETLAAGGVKCLPLPARSPNLNAYAERWVRSIKEECLAKLILFGEKSLHGLRFTLAQDLAQQGSATLGAIGWNAMVA